MADDRIERKELLSKLDSIKNSKDWVKASESLGFRVTAGGKHPHIVRDPDNLNDDDIRTLVTTIPSGLHKRMNKIILLQIISSPISQRLEITEDMVWRAIGLLK